MDGTELVGRFGYDIAKKLVSTEICIQYHSSMSYSLKLIYSGKPLLDEVPIEAVEVQARVDKSKRFSYTDQVLDIREHVPHKKIEV
jgi:hypothetical protein